MSKQVKELPHFSNEDEEREFWATHDSSEYVDASKLKRVGPLDNLKNAGDPILLILPLDISKEVKQLAKENHVTPEKMIEQILALSLRNNARSSART
jgi:hypothetical protein